MATTTEHDDLSAITLRDACGGHTSLLVDEDLHPKSLEEEAEKRPETGEQCDEWGDTTGDNQGDESNGMMSM